MTALVPYAMSDQTAQYDGREVQIIDRESHRGVEVVQIEATDDGVSLSDPSGNAPWVKADEVDE